MLSLFARPSSVFLKTDPDGTGPWVGFFPRQLRCSTIPSQFVLPCLPVAFLLPPQLLFVSRCRRSAAHHCRIFRVQFFFLLLPHRQTHNFVPAARMTNDPFHQSLANDDAPDSVLLQPLLQAALESADPSTTRALVFKVLSAPPELVCGYDQIKAALQEGLRKAPDGDQLSRTLDLFSYGTYADYRTSPQNHYLSLSDAQLHKLRLLTILSLVQQICRERLDYLTYEQVQAALQLDQLSAVEDVLCAAVYAGLVRGQLCQKTRRLVLVAPHPSADATSGVGGDGGPPFRSRDVPPSSAADLLETVRQWQERVAVAARQVAQDRTAVQRELEQQRRAALDRQARTPKSSKDGAPSSFSASGPLGVAPWGMMIDDTTTATAAAAVEYATTGGGRDNDLHLSASRRQKRSRGGLGGMGDPFGGGGGGGPGFQP